MAYTYPLNHLNSESKFTTITISLFCKYTDKFYHVPLPTDEFTYH